MIKENNIENLDSEELTKYKLALSYLSTDIGSYLLELYKYDKNEKRKSFYNQNYSIVYDYLILPSLDIKMSKDLAYEGLDLLEKANELM